MHHFRLIAAVVFVALFVSVRAEEPFLKKNDVIALVGGEDMVAASEYGYLELLLTRALPDYHLKFRNLAWEGDTVFEQPRQLNFPTWEQQLEKVGATVVICQFGQMESLAGKEKLPEFIAAYEKLLVRFSGGGKRRITIVRPIYFEPILMKNPPLALTDIASYERAFRPIAVRFGNSRYDDVGMAVFGLKTIQKTRDGIHLNRAGQMALAGVITGEMLGEPNGLSDRDITLPVQTVLNEIVAKNRLWFDYWRPQNWAFLNGDRISQPSSRDHRDPNIRWFPAEMEQFLPLIAAKEEAIWKLAAELK